VHDMWAWGPLARGWAVVFGGDEETHYLRRWRAPHAVVRLLRTQRPTPEEYDSWARGPYARDWVVGCGRDEEARHHGSTVRSLRGGLPSSHSEISALAI
jgi:hypothetical protein